MKIAIAGTGYVGLSNAVLLAQHNEVIAVDIIQEKVDLINNKKSPISDVEIEDFLANKNLNLTATIDKNLAYKEAEFVVIATPTDYDPSNTASLYAKFLSIVAVKVLHLILLKCLLNLILAKY
jgi:UDPglucose 6-dehydrogenase